MTQLKFNRNPGLTSFNSLFDDLITEVPFFFKNGQDGLDWKGAAPVNIRENEKFYSIDVVAPGFEKTDFKISLDQDILTISGERKEDPNQETNNNKNDKEIRKEYSYRSFKRSFTLDEKIDGGGIEAKYVNGVLTLNLPKKEEVKTSSKDIIIQ